MIPQEDGYFELLDSQGAVGDLYGFYLDDDRHRLLPDPVSRFQPDGPFGPSEVVDPDAFDWSDDAWRRSTLHGQIAYELHIGTFTSEGSSRAAIERLPRLAELGITLIEVMPVNEFAGSFGWGYDGVNLYAPTRLYGRPDDFRAFVDTAHCLGMGVILDVVYNHLGPDGNFLPRFSKHYMSEHHRTDWGDAINFDDEFAQPVRDFFIGNAGYWISEYHLDGLRIDAIHSIKDDSKDHVIACIGREVHRAANGRATVVIVENDHQKAEMLHSIDRGGHGLDAAWNDDYHHAIRVALTGHADFYYGDYQGTPQEILSSVKWGYLFQGQWSPRTKRRADRPAWTYWHRNS
ncbi:MAG: alpha-amylase family glycosyl hydrolase [Pirellulales bacterium]